MEDAWASADISAGGATKFPPKTSTTQAQADGMATPEFASEDTTIFSDSPASTIGGGGHGSDPEGRRLGAARRGPEPRTHPETKR